MNSIHVHPSVAETRSDPVSSRENIDPSPTSHPAALKPPVFPDAVVSWSMCMFDFLFLLEGKGGWLERPFGTAGAAAVFPTNPPQHNPCASAILGIGLQVSAE